MNPKPITAPELKENTLACWELLDTNPGLLKLRNSVFNNLICSSFFNITISYHDFVEAIIADPVLMDGWNKVIFNFNTLCDNRDYFDKVREIFEKNIDLWSFNQEVVDGFGIETIKFNSGFCLALLLHVHVNLLTGEVPHEE